MQTNGGNILQHLKSVSRNSLYSYLSIFRTQSISKKAQSLVLSTQNLCFILILLLLLCALILAPCPAANAATVTLLWDPSSGDVDGYIVYYGAESGNYDYSVDVGNFTSCSISGLQEGETYYFAARAYNANYESNLSEEFVHTIPLGSSNNGSSQNSNSMVIEAEEMSYHAKGAQTGDYWLLWANGTMNEDVNFPATGTYSFEIEAKGDLAFGIGPEMELLIDGQSKGTVFVNTNQSAIFTFEVDVSAGIHEVAIGFKNDYYGSGVDRNLYVDRLTISSH